MGLKPVESNGYATKSLVLRWNAAIIAAMVVVFWTILQTHAGRPHKDAIPRDQFQAFAQSEKEWREQRRIEIRDTAHSLDELHKKVDEQAQRVQMLIVEIIRDRNDRSN